MSKRITATLAICVLASITAGIALARPGSSQETQTVPAGQQPAPAESAASADVPEEEMDHDAMAEMSDGGSAYGDTGSTYGDTEDAGDTGDAANTGNGESDSDADTAADTSADEGIVIDAFQFSGSMTVSAGERVSVVNADGAQHTVTSSDGLFDTGVLDGGGGAGSFTAPTEPGTYTFFCAVHPSMTATLTVVA